MDSLMASYASSDEEEQPPPQRIPPAKPPKSELKAEEEVKDFLPKSSSKRGGFFDSLPPPKASLFNSLPPPKSQSFPNPKSQSEIERKKVANGRDAQIGGNSKPKSSPSSLFSSLPEPKSSSSSAASKRVVQFRPPTITNTRPGSLDDDDDDSDEGEEERKRKRSRESISTSSAASFLSSIPAPRHSATFGALPSGSGMSRRSVIETEALPANVSTANAIGNDVGYSNDQSINTNDAYSSWGSESENNAYYSANGVAVSANVDSASLSSISSGVKHLGDQSHENHSAGLGGESCAYYGAYSNGSTDVNGVDTDYEAVEYSYAPGHHVEMENYGRGYGDYVNNTQNENNWENSAALVSGVVENALPVPGRRGRKDIPPEIIEVNQDELMKNRPREDQVKSTGIAFGPAYQPASTKGKPPKLHKRKHQIGSLYFDMRQKEMELAERRSKGFLTKAQTQAKYGW